MASEPFLRGTFCTNEREIAAPIRALSHPAETCTWTVSDGEAASPSGTRVGASVRAPELDRKGRMVPSRARLMLRATPGQVVRPAPFGRPSDENGLRMSVRARTPGPLSVMPLFRRRRMLNAECVARTGPRPRARRRGALARRPRSGSRGRRMLRLRARRRCQPVEGAETPTEPARWCESYSAPPEPRLVMIGVNACQHPKRRQHERRARADGRKFWFWHRTCVWWLSCACRSCPGACSSSSCRLLLPAAATVGTWLR